MNITRRIFLKKTSTAALVFPFLPSPIDPYKTQYHESLEIHLFSKHLQFLDIKTAGQVAAELGFAGLDVTVRPKGHVLPEHVINDLPNAIRDIQQSGSTCKMITTSIADATNLLDQQLIMTAAKLGIAYYRSNWFAYKKELSLEESLEFYKDQVRQLGDLNMSNGIVGCYQNHSGLKIGASVWEVKKILESTNPDFFGAQYDIRHAVAEGGQSWPNGIELLKDHIKTIVLKDFKWGKVDGKWKIINVPIGEGMVDFGAYFKLLKKLNLRPPVSLHLEYPLGGAEKGRDTITVDKKIVFDAMKKDLTTIQQIWKTS